MSLTNFAAEFLIIPLAMSLGLFASSRSLISKCVLGLGCATILSYILIAENRASWIALAIGLLVSLSVCKLRGLEIPRSTSLLAIMVLCSLLVLGAVSTPYGKRLVKRATSVFDTADPSIKSRLLTWKAAVRIFCDHPLLGVGLGNAEVLIPKYADTELEKLYIVSNSKIDQVHNEYLQVLAESGFFGVMAFGFLIGSLVWLSIRIWPNGSRLWQFIVLLAGLAAFLAMMTFSFPLRNPSTALYFWLTIALLETLAKPGSPIKVPRRPTVVIFGVMSAVFAGLTYFSIRAAKADLDYNIAEAYLKLQRWEEAAAYATKAIGLNREVEKYFYLRGLANENLKQFGRAASDFRRCVELAPYFERAHFRLASTYYRLRELEKARDEFTIAGSLMPSRRGQVASALLPVYMDLMDFPKALEAGEEAVRLDPLNVKYRYELAYAYSVSGRQDKAAEQCRKALDLKPDFAPARMLLALVEQGAR